MVWVPAFRIVNVHTDNTFDCIRRLCEHRKIVHWKITEEDKSLPYQVIEPASVWRLAFWSDDLPTELYRYRTEIRAENITPLKGNRAVIV